MHTQSLATATTPKKRQVQPRHHAPKGRLAVDLRRKKIIKAIITGKTNRQAGIDSGLSPKTAATQVTAILKEPETQLTLRTAMEKLGMTDAYLAAHLRQLIGGTKIISANIIVTSGSDLADAGSITRDFIEVPDNQALAKGLEIACKVKGVFSEKREHEIKRPVTILVRRFCAEEDAPPVSGSGEGAT
jgi:hypothetical protein